MQPGYYIKSDGFNKVVEAVNNDIKDIVLVGPSGCGKSFTLLALWHYFKTEDTSKGYPVIITANTLSTLHEQLKGKHQIPYYTIMFVVLLCIQSSLKVGYKGPEEVAHAL